MWVVNKTDHGFNATLYEKGAPLGRVTSDNLEKILVTIKQYYQEKKK